MKKYFVLFVLLGLLSFACNSGNSNNDLIGFAEQIIERISYITNVKQELKSLRKDEFEKTEDFEKRRQVFIRNKTKVLTSLISDTSHFSIKLDGLTYNVDTEKAEPYAKWPSKIKDKLKETMKNFGKFGIDRKDPFYIDVGWVSVFVYDFPVDLARDLKQSTEKKNASMKFTCAFSLSEDNDGWRGIKIGVLNLEIKDDSTGKIFFDM